MRGSTGGWVYAARAAGESALEGNREIQQGRRSRFLMFALDGLIDHLFDIRTTATTAQAGAGGTRHIPRRACALPDEAANLSVGDSAAMANEHRISLSGFVRTSAFYSYRK